MSCRAGITDAYGIRLARIAAGLFMLLGLAFCLAGAANAQWQVSSPDGKSTLKLGFLLQGRAEWTEDYEAAHPDDEWTSQNLYLRRLRLLFGGNLDERVSFFAETDAPNFGKVATRGTKEKDFADLYLQDFVVTWKVTPALLLDTGLILAPGTYNHMQSATSLLAADYGPYTFGESSLLKAKVARDTGALARGMILGKHFEYRAGIFQGLRAGKANTPFRCAGRVAWSPSPTDLGLFYPGPSLGKKTALLIGLSGDVQSDFRSYGADVVMDRPLGAGTSLMVQGDVARYDGGDLLPSMPPQTAYLLEVGPTIWGNRLMPFAQLARLEFDRAAADETSLQTGVAWWLNGHRATVKAAWTRVRRDGAAARDQFLLQCQAFGY
jgi:hypothetical protein